MTFLCLLGLRLTLNDQIQMQIWCTFFYLQFNYDTVRQSDFTKLLDAAILGTKITYHPESIIELSKFLDSDYIQDIIEEVK